LMTSVAPDSRSNFTLENKGLPRTSSFVPGNSE
jgi:hypothetical protein